MVSFSCVINMVEELRKYKDILARDCKEFREQMEREVSVFLPFQIDRKEVVSEPGVTEFL